MCEQVLEKAVPSPLVVEDIKLFWSQHVAHYNKSGAWTASRANATVTALINHIVNVAIEENAPADQLLAAIGTVKELWENEQF